MFCSIPHQACREATDGSGEVYAIGDANSATFEEDEDFLYIVYKSKTADVERWEEH